MDDSLHYLLLAAQGLFQRRVMARLEGTGLTAGQPKVLDFLGRHDGSVQKRIAAGCHIDPATLTGLLGRMEEKGLILRRSEGGDRRALHVYLTEEGWRLQKQVRRQMEELEEQVLSGLDGPERSQLLLGLRAVCLAMTEEEELQ